MCWREPRMVGDEKQISEGSEKSLGKFGCTPRHLCQEKRAVGRDSHHRHRFIPRPSEQSDPGHGSQPGAAARRPRALACHVAREVPGLPLARAARPAYQRPLHEAATRNLATPRPLNRSARPLQAAIPAYSPSLATQGRSGLPGRARSRQRRSMCSSFILLIVRCNPP